MNELCPNCKGIDHVTVDDCPHLSLKEKTIWMKGENQGIRYERRQAAVDINCLKTIIENLDLQAAAFTDGNVDIAELERKRIEKMVSRKIVHAALLSAKDDHFQNYITIKRGRGFRVFLADHIEKVLKKAMAADHIGDSK